ncbi:hypothetical protein GBA52_011308 [Prunus armeniaca]|nr:hypothetical protein GBA52_011308 [Prunus armeniaca]
MDCDCPIDAELRSEISALLTPPSPAQVDKYLDEQIKSSNRHCYGIKIKQNGELGKGVYAELGFKEGELIIKDQMLVGLQHSSNKIDCLVCSFCFRFIGSVELQIGRRLYLQELGVSASQGCCQTDYSSEDDDLGDSGPSSSSCKEKVPLPKGFAESLMNGALKLPYSDKFPLPPAVPCHGGCGEAYYCSKLCAESDWDLSHSLLCTGEKSEAVSRGALVKFIQHANDTNDIFLLAAKAVSASILKYRKLKVAHSEEQENKPNVSGIPYPSLLLEAWKPMSVGHKRRWWDCIALPFDVESSDEVAFRMQIRELAFMSLQLLKAAIFDEECKSLFSLDIYGHIIGMFELNNLDLVVASPVEDYFLYIDDLPYPEKVRIHIFLLTFCQVECSNVIFPCYSWQKEAEEITRPFLDALGDDYSVCCQGTAFYPLQSCMNHSCSPNAKAFKREEDRDGQATIIALKPISKGEEVTISYVDEDLPFEERQALLADYGFTCRNYALCTSSVCIASQKLQKRCPLSEGAIIWNQVKSFTNDPLSRGPIIWNTSCPSRYSNAKFFGIIDTNNTIYLVAPESNGNPLLIRNGVHKLLTRLCSRVVRKPPYAHGYIGISNVTSLYGATECTLDLSSIGCMKYLDVGEKELIDHTYGKIGGCAIYRSCYTRFEFYRFYW